MGRAPVVIDARETAAHTHALLRAKSGFDINQLAAEYRALRASVLVALLATSRTPTVARALSAPDMASRLILPHTFRAVEGLAFLISQYGVATITAEFAVVVGRWHRKPTASRRR